MKISVDAGAICVPSYKRFGTYTFTTHLLSALSQYDRENSYYAYSFCNKPSTLALYSNFFYKVMYPKLLWMKLRVPFEEMFVRKDIFLALNQAIPWGTRAKIIGFSHGVSFIKHPKIYGYSALSMKNQLAQMMKKCSSVVVTSQRVKDEILLLYPRNIEQVVVLQPGLPAEFVKHTKHPRQQFFLFCGMNHPIKQVDTIVDAFTRLTQDKQCAKYSLYLVGPFEKYKKKHKRIQIFPRISREKLRDLYQKASAYLTASKYESFNFPVLEAVSQGCPVIGLHTAIVPEFAEHCTVCADEEQLFESMKKAAVGDVLMPDIKKIHEQFSWKDYVAGLAKLYHH